MDNLRAYAEDDSASSPGTGQLATRTPPSSIGLSTSSSSLTSPMTAPTTQVTSRPVPEVSAPTSSASTVLQDKTVAVEDLPPPPAEPYEQFLARVSWEIATLPVGPPRSAAAGPPRPAVPIPTTGSRLPMPFPRYENALWASQPQAPVPRIRMPLPASCFVTPPSPWNWPGRGPAVPAPQVRSPALPPSMTWPLRLPGPAALPRGPPTTGPIPVLPPPSSSHDLKNTSPPPQRFRGFFPGATPPFVPMAPASSENAAALPHFPQDAGNILQGPTQEMVQSWKAEWFEDMKLYWQQLQGDAPPQSTAGSAVSQGNMGPYASASTVLQDKTVAVEDLPPPPAEPYEQFLARVSWEIATLPVGPPRSAAAGPPRPAVPIPTTGSRLPMPFPRYENALWASQPQAPVPRIRMPLPASCFVTPPSPWNWPGRGPAVPAPQVRSPALPPSMTWPLRLPGPAALPRGPPTTGPIPVLPPPSSSHDLKNTSPPPQRFRGFFPGATPPFVPMAPASSENAAALPHFPQDAGNILQGPTQEMVQSWKAEWFEDMKLYWQQLQGDAPPQSTAGSAVSQGNMGPYALRPLSPSDDREASRAQHKSGTKRAGSDSRNHSSSRERSSVDRFRPRDRRPPTSPDSSSPTRHRSPTAKRSRRDRRERSNDSCSSEGRQRSQRHRRPWSSRSPGHWRRDHSPSPSPPRRYRSSPAPSRRSSGAGMTKGPAGRPSPSPPRRSSSHRRRSRHPSRDCLSPPPPRSREPHHRLSSSSSRSPSPKRPRTENISHSRRASRSVSQERGQHPYDTDIRLLRLRADTDDEHYPPSTHPRGSPEPGESASVDDADLSAAKVQKLFADLIPPPELSHYGDPIPDSASNKQLVPYVHPSEWSSASLQNSEPLETHGLFQNYQSFHRLSGDSEKEACTAAYHDLTNIMLSQTEEPSLINVSSARPKTDDPFLCGAISSNEMKKKHEQLLLQWPP